MSFSLSNEVFSQLAALTKSVRLLERKIDDLENANEPLAQPESIEEGTWFHRFDKIKPEEDRTILMKDHRRDIPPWIGYFDGENYIAYETRLPIMHTHWKYIE